MSVGNTESPAQLHLSTRAYFLAIVTKHALVTLKRSAQYCSVNVTLIAAFCPMLTSPCTVFNYTFTCDFRGLISKIIGCTSTPALKMPIMHLPWLYLFKCVSMLLFHTLLLQLLHNAQCRISLSYPLLKIQ